jgi:unsaturated rhamnogalacturonyl hydrolase
MDINSNKVESVKRAMLAMQRFSWEQGVAAQALLELGEKDWVILMAHDAVIRQTKDGRLGMMSDSHGATDPAANGEAVIFAAKSTREPIYKEAAQRMMDWLLKDAPRSDRGILYHVTNKKEFWVDSFYMAPPTLAAAGYLKEAVWQIEGYREILWNDEKKLFSHMWDDENHVFLRKDFWGVGNGWAAAGMIRVLQTLSETMTEEKTRISGYIKDVIDGCLVFMREDGLFHDVLDNPDTFVETNVGQMLSYSIYHGVAQGFLDSNYLEYADKMREAAHNKVDEYGLVQEVCGAPFFDKSGTATEGQAFFLLMESAYHKLAK